MNRIVATFAIGALAGIAAMTWVVFYPLPWWKDRPAFSTYPDTCIVSDLGNTTFQVYCPE